jgi:peptidoglycan/LPS O-acetylase OafA/YrhL
LLERWENRQELRDGMNNNSVIRVDTKFLDGLRFIFALWVSIGHYYILIGANNFYEIPVIGKFIMNPAVAVDGFIVITGFLMMYHYINRQNIERYNEPSTIINFWLRRFFRLYPVYIIAILVSFYYFTDLAVKSNYILEFFTGSSQTPWGTTRSTDQPSLLSLITHIFFIHGLIPSHSTDVLGVAWSLSLEAQFYLFFPFIYWFFFKDKKVIYRKLVFFLIASILVSIIFPKIFGYYGTGGILSNFSQPSVLFYKLPLFLLGMLMAGVILNRIPVFYLAMSLIILLPLQGETTSCIIVFILICLFSERLRPYIGQNVYKIISFAKEILSNKISKLGADISYTLYLIHTILIPPVVSLCIDKLVIYNINNYTIAIFSFLIFLIASIVLSYFTFIFIERPFIKIGKSIIKKAADKNQEFIKMNEEKINI